MRDESRLAHLFLGRAGEALVASHLLRAGFNAQSLPVDSGIDLLAERVTAHGEHLLYQFQVKTTSKSRFRLTFSQLEFQALIEGGVNLVIVLWPPNQRPEIIVLPPTLLYRCKGGPIIDATGVTIHLTRSERGIYLGPRNERVQIDAMCGRVDRADDTGTDCRMQDPDYLDWNVDGRITFLDSTSEVRA